MITPEDVFDLMEEDLKVADLILWVGISFEQSASTAYFRRVSIQASGKGLVPDMFLSSTPAEQRGCLAYFPEIAQHAHEGLLQDVHEWIGTA